MVIFEMCGKLAWGVNDDGDLFLGDDKSGYNLPDTTENWERVKADFDRHKTAYKE